MRTAIARASKADIYEIVMQIAKERFTPDEVAYFKRCVTSASQLWTGFIDGELVCIWALVPPSFLSNGAYLWLYTTDALAGNEFVFVRQSQIATQAMLRQYEYIEGHVHADNVKGVRWLRWLGAEFGLPIGKAIPFVIRRK